MRPNACIGNGPPVIWLGFLNRERAENNESVEVFGRVAPGRRLQATLAAPPARVPSAKRLSANESRMIRDVGFSASGSRVKKAIEEQTGWRASFDRPNCAAARHLPCFLSPIWRRSDLI
jgi:hypothetical protein